MKIWSSESDCIRSSLMVRPPFFSIPCMILAPFLELPTFLRRDQPLHHIGGTAPPSSPRLVPSSLITQRVQHLVLRMPRETDQNKGFKSGLMVRTVHDMPLWKGRAPSTMKIITVRPYVDPQKQRANKMFWRLVLRSKPGEHAKTHTQLFFGEPDRPAVY